MVTCQTNIEYHQYNSKYKAVRNDWEDLSFIMQQNNANINKYDPQ